MRIIFWIFCIQFGCLYSQNNYPQGIFCEPMELPLELSGTFSEIRSVQFHTGIDIRLKERRNFNVLSVADGYISRIKIEPGGYGKALYISHPSGYTSVYAHLDSLTPSLEGFVKNAQYKNKKFPLDTILPKNLFPVQKKQLIGFAGNSGYSFGPHLHFEIRETASEQLLNPLLFGLKVIDTTPPKFIEIKIYNLTNSFDVINDNIIYNCVQQKDGTYSIGEIPEMIGLTGIGIRYSDRQNSTNPNSLEIRNMKLFVNDTLYSEMTFDRLIFSTLRHQLACIDFAQRKADKRVFLRTYRLPGNRSPVYTSLSNDGKINISDKKNYSIRCEITDAVNNTSILKFNIKGMLPADKAIQLAPDTSNTNIFRWNKSNTYKNQAFLLRADSGVFFEDFKPEFTILNSSLSKLSPLIDLKNKIPLASSCSLTIYSDKITKPEKTIIALISDKNTFTGIKTICHSKSCTADITEFEKYVLIEDTIPPLIKPYNFPAKNIFSKRKEICFTITDNTGIIQTYNGFINGKWVLFEYDLKNDRLVYKIDKQLPINTSEVKIIVTDIVGNTSELIQKVIYRPFNHTKR